MLQDTVDSSWNMSHSYYNSECAGELMKGTDGPPEDPGTRFLKARAEGGLAQGLIAQG